MKVDLEDRGSSPPQRPRGGRNSRSRGRRQVDDSHPVLASERGGEFINHKLGLDKAILNTV